MNRLIHSKHGNRGPGATGIRIESLGADSSPLIEEHRSGGIVPPSIQDGSPYWSWERPITVLGWSTTTPVFPVTVRLPTMVLLATATPPEFPFTVTTARALA